MTAIKVYDKVTWHFPEGNKCPSAESAKRQFNAVMRWLSKENLLTDEGKESWSAGVDMDFSITSAMLTDRGNQLFRSRYSQWLNQLDYDKESTMEELDAAFYGQ